MIDVPKRRQKRIRYLEQPVRLPGYEGPVLLYVGRFTAVKRVPLLIEAYSAAQERFRERAPLVLVGGFPDEFEGEHPDEAIARTGARDVHLAGWHEHAALAAQPVLPDLCRANWREPAAALGIPSQHSQPTHTLTLSFPRKRT